MDIKELDNLLEESTKAIEKIDKCIEKGWFQLKEENTRIFWWNERELIMPFYFHLRPLIEEVNRDFETIQIQIVPEYAPKASSYAKRFEVKYPYPILNKGKKEFERTKHVDLCIVAFDSDDYINKMKIKEITRWYIRHVPLILVELKVNAKKYLLKKEGIEKDLKKCAEIKRRYYGVEKIYLGCLTGEEFNEEEFQNLMKKAGLNNLTVCHGTWPGKNEIWYKREIELNQT